MTAITDAQASATTNGTVDKKAFTSGSTAVPVRGQAAVSTPVFVSGTAQQLSTSLTTFLYINVTTAASLKVQMGPTNTAANVINAAESDALGLLSLRVPAGWYVMVTGTIADVAFTAIND